MDGKEAKALGWAALCYGLAFVAGCTAAEVSWYAWGWWQRRKAKQLERAQVQAVAEQRAALPKEGARA